MARRRGAGRGWAETTAAHSQPALQAILVKRSASCDAISRKPGRRLGIRRTASGGKTFSAQTGHSWNSMRNRVALAVGFACPIPADFLDFVAAACGAMCNFDHDASSLSRPLRRDKEIIRFDSRPSHQLAFRINRQPFEVRTPDDIEVFSGFSQRTCGAERLVNRHGIEDRFHDVPVRDGAGIHLQRAFSLNS